MVNHYMLHFFCCKYCTCNFADFNTFKKHVQSHEVIYHRFWLTRGNALACKCGYMVQANGLRTHTGCHYWKDARRARSKHFAFSHWHPAQITSLVRRTTVKTEPYQYSHTIRYEASHSLPEHECPHCGYGFRKLKNLQKHMKVHTGETNYKCEECSRHFVSKTGLEYHQMSAHSDDKPFKCDLCGHGFIKFQHMERHKRTHLIEKPYKCQICHRGYITNSNLKVHERTHLGIKQFHCKYCGRGFWQKGHMKDHMLGHGKVLDGNPNMCDICKRTFFRKKNLIEHYRTHTGEKPYKCSYCDQAYATNGLMLRHVRRHTGQNPYKCDQCEQSFTAPGNLKRHVMRNHTGVRPYICGICGKGFAFISDLRTHEQTHLPASAKPLKCQVCDRGYSIVSKLRIHMKTHSGERPFKCNYEGCQKSFATSSRRSRHMSTHTGAKNYKCTKCVKAFSQPGNLKRHLRNHEGVKPYKCMSCDYSSAEKSNLKRHVKYKHPLVFNKANLLMMLEPSSCNSNASFAVNSENADSLEDKAVIHVSLGDARNDLKSNMLGTVQCVGLDSAITDRLTIKTNGVESIMFVNAEPSAQEETKSKIQV